MRGLDSLHNQAGYAHMDLKLDNVLVGNDGHIKLCDFGFSQYSQTQVSKIIGTPCYMAPEIHMARVKPCDGKSADLFSLGVLMYILAFGMPPFHQATTKDPYFKLLIRKPEQAVNFNFFRFHPHTRVLYREDKIDKALMTLLLALMQVDPQDRVNNINELYDFEFLQDISAEDNDLLKMINELNTSGSV